MFCCFGKKYKNKQYQNDVMTHVNNFIQKIKRHKPSEITITELIMFKCYLEQDIDPNGYISVPQNQQEIQENLKQILWKVIFEKAFSETVK